MGFKGPIHCQVLRSELAFEPGHPGVKQSHYHITSYLMHSIRKIDEIPGGEEWAKIVAAFFFPER